jgi:hypothetical protein
MENQSSNRARVRFRIRAVHSIERHILGRYKMRDGAIIDPVFAVSRLNPDQRHHGRDLLSRPRSRNPCGCDQFLRHFQFAKRCQKGLQPACASRNVASPPNIQRGQSGDSGKPDAWSRTCESFDSKDTFSIARQKPASMG